MRGAFVLLIAVIALSAPVAPIPVSAEALRGDVTFLASDKLEGRKTPSPGLNAAADYIAAAFRKARLIPLGQNATFFQNAPFVQLLPDLSDFALTLRSGNRTVRVKAGDVITQSGSALDFADAPMVSVRGPIAGKIAVGRSEDYSDDAAVQKLRAQKPALILLFSADVRPKEDPVPQVAETASPVPVLFIYDGPAARMLSGQRPTISLHLSAPAVNQITLRNVIGCIRGTDPALRDQYVLLTAHYDHVGTLPAGKGDRIFNGANDNASGTASVIEIGAALMANGARPKRTLVFMTLFGEEIGLVGSTYYVHHPVVPLAKTVAAINLEQMGRTDAMDGGHVGEFSINGPSFSNLLSLITPAAQSQGVKIYKKSGADAYFDRSDNYAFALAGVVAHTAAVAFEFPDYHAVSDEAAKLNYQNMAKVDAGIAAALLELANGPAPQWSNEPGAQRYNVKR